MAPLVMKLHHKNSISICTASQFVFPVSNRNSTTKGRPGRPRKWNKYSGNQVKTVYNNILGYAEENKGNNNRTPPSTRFIKSSYMNNMLGKNGQGMLAGDGTCAELLGALRLVCFSIIMSQEKCSSLSREKDFYADTLKWKSQEMTKAKTIQARRKFRNLWPCQKFRISVGRAGAAAVATSVVSFHCSINSASFAPETFRATDPHISQILQSEN